MIRNYITSRSSLPKFFGLALLLSLLIIDPSTSKSNWFGNFFFLFISFIPFRFLDDAGSLTIDRKAHPERSYLLVKNFPLFVMITALIIAIYLLYVASFVNFAFYFILAFIASSVLIYVLFQNTKSILEILPILKYPALLWCLTHFSRDTEILFQISTSFILVYVYDKLDVKSIGTKDRVIAVFSVLLCGILIFQPWNNLMLSLFIIPVPLAVAFLYKWNPIKYLPLVYFPLLNFLLTII